MERQENYFRNWEDWESSADYQAYAHHWTQRSQDLMGFAWRFCVNCAWVHARLCNNEHDRIYQHLIYEAREYRRRADDLCLTKADRELVEQIYDLCRRELFAFYQAKIYDYCVAK